MATRRNNSIIGDYRGKLGPTVLSESFGVGTARSMPSKRGKKALSAGQKKHTDTFSSINKFLRFAKEAINLGYQQTKNPKMSPFNAAVSWHFYHALADDPKNGVLDFEKIKLSCPVRKTQKAWEPLLSADEKNRISVRWKLNPSPQKCTQLDDRAVIAVHFHHKKSSRFMIYENAAMRSDLNFTTQLPVLLKGQEVHCYLFMIAADKKLVSETQYLGMVKLQA